MQHTAVFRCNGGGGGGLGHVSRSIALAEAMCEIGWGCIFLGVMDASASNLISAAGFDLVRLDAVSGSAQDATQTAVLASETFASVIVLDSYDFSPEYALRLLQNNVRVVVIDDFASWTRYPADVVINFTIAATQRLYPRGNAHLLLGLSYFLARSKMRRLRAQALVREKTRFRCCIALSSDYGGRQSLAVLQALRGEAADFRLILARGLPKDAVMGDLLGRMGANCELRICPPDLAEDLAWADIAICTGGMVKYEALYLGVVPFVLSSNAGEAADTRLWEEKGVAYDLGLATAVDSDALVETFRALLMNGRERFDIIRNQSKLLFTDDPTMNAARQIAEICA